MDTAVEHDHCIPDGGVSNLSHPRQIDDGGPVHAHELRAIQSLLQRRQRFANKVTPAAGMDGRVVVVSLNPLDFRHIDDEVGSGSAKNQSPWSLVLWIDLAGIMPERPRPSTRAVNCFPAAEALARAFERSLKSRFMDRFDQIVDGVRIKGSYGEGVVCRHHDDERQTLRVKLAKHVKPVALGHLDIEEDEIGR